MEGAVTIAVGRGEESPPSSLDDGGRAAPGPRRPHCYEAEAVTMSVRFAGSPVPMANSGRKVLPALDKPSYSPTKNPNGPRANGSCSTSNEVSVSRSSLPQSPASAHVVTAEG